MGQLSRTHCFGGLTIEKRHGEGIPCPLCFAPTVVKDSRGYKNDPAIRRRRMCKDCGYRFSTVEQVTVKSRIYVSKRDGSREPFDKEKLKASLRIALAKRNVTEERIDRIAQGIAECIDDTNNNKSTRSKGGYLLVTSVGIGDLVMQSLKQLDPISYVRYCSVFNRFHSLADYQVLLDTFH